MSDFFMARPAVGPSSSMQWPVLHFEGGSGEWPYTLYRHVWGRYVLNFYGNRRTAVVDDFGDLVMVPSQRGVHDELAALRAVWGRPPMRNSLGYLLADFPS